MRHRLPLLILLAFNTTLVHAQEMITVAASHRYGHPTLIQKVFVGSNYRRIWSTPVEVKIFHLNTEKGGLTVKELGGGMQTKSLHLEYKNGRKWVLRSI